MWILDSGRKSFLEFLRNTSIQFFLMFLTSISAGKFNTLVVKHDYKNAVPMGLISILIFALLYLAAHANIKNFFIEFRDGTVPGLKPYLQSLDKHDLKSKNRLTLSYILKNGKSAFAEACLLITGFYFVMILGCFYSAMNAQNFMIKEEHQNLSTPVECSHQI